MLVGRDDRAAWEWGQPGPGFAWMNGMDRIWIGQGQWWQLRSEQSHFKPGHPPVLGKKESRSRAVRTAVTNLPIYGRWVPALGWGVVGRGEGVGGAAPEAVYGVTGVGRIGREADGDAQLADILDGREGRHKAGAVAQALDDVADPGRIAVAVDDGLHVADQATHAAVHAQEGKPAPARVDGVEPLRGKGVHLTEGLDMAVGEVAVADNPIEGSHQLAAGGVAQAGIDRRSRGGVAGGAAQGVGGAVGAFIENVLV